MNNKILRRISLVLVTILLSCFFLTGCANTQREEQFVMAEVTSKEFIEAHTEYGYFFDGFKLEYRWKLKHFPAKYNVTITYEGLPMTYNQKSLYDLYDIGDSIEMKYITYYDEENKLITEGIYAPTISLP